MMGAPTAPGAPRDGNAAAAQRPLRLLIVDDHALVREGLRACLQAEAGLSVVGEAANAAEAVAVARDARADVVLMDVALRGASGIEAAAS